MKQVIKSMMTVSQKHFFKSRILMLRIARFTSSWQSSLCCFISSVLIRAKVNFSPGYNRFYWVSFRSSYGSTERMSSDRCDRHFVVNLEINHSFEGNQIVLNEAHVGKGEQLRAGKPRKEDDIEVREHSPEPWWVLTGNTLQEDRHSVSREEFRGLNGLEKKYNLIIVGAGLSGSVIAERASKMLGLKVMWSVESREGTWSIFWSESGDWQERAHWGELLWLYWWAWWVLYFFISQHNLECSGIRTSLYGVHIFHTKYDRVKEYVSQFSEWIPYEHRVVAKAKDVKVGFSRYIQ